MKNIRKCLYSQKIVLNLVGNYPQNSAETVHWGRGLLALVVTDWDN